jgi:hypothetical protein
MFRRLLDLLILMMLFMFALMAFSTVFVPA